MSTLRRMKGVRGTVLDPFGHSKVRRTERAMVKDYIALVDEASKLLATDAGQALALVSLVDQVRGYESVKMANVERYRQALATARKPDRQQAFSGPTQSAANRCRPRTH